MSETEILAIVCCYCLVLATVCDIPDLDEALLMETKRLISQHAVLDQFRQYYSSYMMVELFNSPWEHTLGLKPLALITTVLSCIPKSKHSLFTHLIRTEAVNDPTVYSIVRRGLEKLPQEVSSQLLDTMVASLTTHEGNSQAIKEQALHDYNRLFLEIKQICI
jgi:hypothetical protein